MNSFGTFKDVDIPKDFINHTTIGTHNSGNTMAPGGEYSDFNIWDRALTNEEAVNWTNCK